MASCLDCKSATSGVCDACRQAHDAINHVKELGGVLCVCGHAARPGGRQSFHRTDDEAKLEFVRMTLEMVLIAPTTSVRASYDGCTVFAERSHDGAAVAAMVVWRHATAKVIRRTLRRLWLPKRGDR